VPKKRFLEASFLAIDGFQRGSALSSIELKLVGKLIDNFLAGAEFFDDSSIFQKGLEKGASDLCSSWHRQLLEHSTLVAHVRTRLRAFGSLFKANVPLAESQLRIGASTSSISKVAGVQREQHRWTTDAVIS
jgi:hypothetical protein